VAGGSLGEEQPAIIATNVIAKRTTGMSGRFWVMELFGAESIS
jgi:hypothetical protein